MSLVYIYCAGTPGVEWSYVQIQTWSETEVEFYFAYFGPDESINQSIHDITQDLNNFENWGTFTIPHKIVNPESGEVIAEQSITIECNF